VKIQFLTHDYASALAKVCVEIVAPPLRPEE